MTTTKGLGHRQRSVLNLLKTRGAWYPGCGWMCSTWDGTIKILDSLVARGLVTKTEPSTYTLVEK